MAGCGSGGLLFCTGLLLAMPALAATPADRDACAVGGGLALTVLLCKIRDLRRAGKR